MYLIWDSCQRDMKLCWLDWTLIWRVGKNSFTRSFFLSPVIGRIQFLISAIEQSCHYLKNDIFCQLCDTIMLFFSRSNIQTYSVGFGKCKEPGSWALVCIEITWVTVAMAWENSTPAWLNKWKAFWKQNNMATYFYPFMKMLKNILGSLISARFPMTKDKQTQQ